MPGSSKAKPASRPAKATSRKTVSKVTKSPTKSAAPAKASAKKAPVAKKAVPKAPAKKAPVAKKAVPAKAAPAKATATKAPPAKAAPVKAPAAKALPAKAPPAKAAPAKAAVAPKPAAPVKKAPPKKVVLDKFLLAQRELLLSEKATYTRQADALRAEADQLAQEMEPGDIQFDEESGEGGTMNVERERDLALSAQARLAVEEIDRALAKIEIGTYGICEVCGKPIPRDRLKALPQAALCVACKSGGLSARR